jgi:hypothetical protein
VTSLKVENNNYGYKPSRRPNEIEPELKPTNTTSLYEKNSTVTLVIVIAVIVAICYLIFSPTTPVANVAVMYPVENSQKR